jgi:hypothetical protein
MARRGKGPAQGDPNQLLIDWKPAAAVGESAAAAPVLVETALPARPAVEPLVQRLPWDFKTSFPQPTDDAIDNGFLDETDRQPENLRSLHENYFAQCLATLKERDTVLDARRTQMDPKTGSRPRSHAGREAVVAMQIPFRGYVFKPYDRSSFNDFPGCHRSAVGALYKPLRFGRSARGRNDHLLPRTRVRLREAFSKGP